MHRTIAPRDSNPTPRKASRAIKPIKIVSPAQSGSAMRAVIQHEYGSADVLHIDQIDRPRVGEDEVLLQVHAAGLDRGT